MSNQKKTRRVNRTRRVLFSGTEAGGLLFQGVFVTLTEMISQTRPNGPEREIVHMGIALISEFVDDPEVFAVAEIVVKSFKTDAEVRLDLVLDAETSNPTGLRVAILKSVIRTDEGGTTGCVYQRRVHDIA